MYKLNLNEIPAEGRSYRFTRATGEITAELFDLLGSNDFEMDFVIRPMGNIFELKGTLRTGTEQVCAKCGWDLRLPLQRSFQEYLVAEGDQPRGSKAVHGNQSLDLESDGPDYLFYQGEHFRVGEYFHELIGISQPIYPSCGLSDCEHLKEVEQILSQQNAEGADVRPPSAFEALKDLKLSKH